MSIPERDEFLDCLEMGTKGSTKLAVCQRLLRESCGVDTPFAEFMVDLIGLASVRPVTRSDIYAKLPEFDQNWRDAVEIAANFITSVLVAARTALQLNKDGVKEKKQNV